MGASSAPMARNRWHETTVPLSGLPARQAVAARIEANPRTEDVCPMFLGEIVPLISPPARQADAVQTVSRARDARIATRATTQKLPMIGANSTLVVWFGSSAQIVRQLSGCPCESSMCGGGMLLSTP